MTSSPFLSQRYGTIHIWRLWKLSNFQDPLLPCPSTSKSFPPPWPWTSNFKVNLLHPTTNYGTTTSPCMWTNEIKTKTKAKPSHVTFKYNISTFGSAWCLFMAQIQFSLIKRIKIGCPEHSLPLTTLRPIISHFCLNPTPPHPSPLKVDVICVSPLMFITCS